MSNSKYKYETFFCYILIDHQVSNLQSLTHIGSLYHQVKFAGTATLINTIFKYCLSNQDILED